MNNKSTLEEILEEQEHISDNIPFDENKHHRIEDLSEEQFDNREFLLRQEILKCLRLKRNSPIYAIIFEKRILNNESIEQISDDLNTNKKQIKFAISKIKKDNRNTFLDIFKKYWVIE